MIVEWAAFEYREFYDYPRVLIVEKENARYLLDCRFDDVTNDYPNEYQIRQLGDVPIPRGSWVGLGDDKALLSTIVITPQLFDITRRKRIRWDLIRAKIGNLSG